ncbi:unnamed protein product [Protopolystoma xenopodis]|uniref:DNA polymerase epsilon catalytic subunit n=1 Tax=Protopolystoma xenopodis TaxID=117903 RepID=A0A448X1G0_9PLAT|nr:unnamed protein product [Protopolystoma xenopodis]
MDRRMGFEPFTGPGDQVGWLFTMQPTDILDPDSKRLASRVYQPYFFVAVKGKPGIERDVITYLTRKYAGRLARVDTVEKEDLDLQNHLIGLKATFLRLAFYTVQELLRVRRDLSFRVAKNKELAKLASSYTDLLAEHFSTNSTGPRINISATDDNGKSLGTSASIGRNYEGPLDALIDLREYDVPYLMRVCIDLNIFAAHWYTVRCLPGQVIELLLNETTAVWPDPIVLAFDIETTKLPLKFPDATIDQVGIYKTHKAYMHLNEMWLCRIVDKNGMLLQVTCSYASFDSLWVKLIFYPSRLCLLFFMQT